MVRNDHVEVVCQLIVKFEPLRAAGVMVQDENRPPTAGAGKMQLDPSQLDSRFSPLGNGRHHDTSRRACLRLSPRCALLQRLHRTPELQKSCAPPDLCGRQRQDTKISLFCAGCAAILEYSE